MTDIWFSKLTSDIKLSVRILIASNSNIKIKEILGTERFVLSVEECYERQKSLDDYFLLCFNCFRVSI